MYKTPRPLQSPLTGTLHTPTRDHRPTPRSAAAAGDDNDMKPVPLLLLLSSVLLSSHLRPAAGRPRLLPGWLDGSGRAHTQQQPPDAALPRAGTSSDLLDAKILRILDERHPEPLLLLPSEESEEEVQRKRSEEPPLSIDLTFHLLRSMIQMAKTESQREQAQLNRKVLDEVGK